MYIIILISFLNCRLSTILKAGYGEQGACHVGSVIRTNQGQVFRHVRRPREQYTVWASPDKRAVRAIWASPFIRHACHLGYIGVIPRRLLLFLNPTTSSSQIEEQRRRINRATSTPSIFRFNQSISSLWFRFTSLFSYFFIYWSSFQSTQNPRTTPSLIHGDETKWKGSCLLRLWRKSHVIQRCLSRSACSSVALPTHSFLGGSEPDQENAYWSQNAPHRRAGESILQKIVSIPWDLFLLRILNVCFSFGEWTRDLRYREIYIFWEC